MEIRTQAKVEKDSSLSGKAKAREIGQYYVRFSKPLVFFCEEKKNKLMLTGYDYTSFVTIKPSFAKGGSLSRVTARAATKT